jgi:ABC-type multidrug transport system fused ATPase/permease subunit
LAAEDESLADRSGAGGALRQLSGLVPARSRRAFWSVFALMLAAALAEVVTIGAVFPLLTLLTRPESSAGLPWLAGLAPRDPAAAAALLAVAAVAAGALRLRLSLTTQRFAYGLGHDISVEIQSRVLSQPYSWHVAHASREILASLEKAQLIASGVAVQAVQAMTGAVIALFIVAALMSIDPVAAAVAAALLGLVYAAVSRAAHRRLARHSQIVSSAFGERIGIVQESLGGIRDVIIDEAQPLYLDAFRRIDGQLSRARAAAGFIATAPRFAVEAAGIALVALAALLLSRGEGGFAAALPVLGALALGAQRLLPLVQQVYQGWSSIKANRRVTEDVIELLRLPVEDLGDDIAPLPLEQEIRLEGVGLSYPGRSEPALSGIDLVIDRGARVAIIGETGSGKSTLADLLMGLLEPSIGRISVDGAPLDRARRRAWRRSIAHVPQSIFLADGSIERNIAFGSEPDAIDRERVVAAAQRARIADFIASLPQGYDTQVGERGVRLSGGQRQRVGIARAIYKNAPVLVLDEATSALDDATEAAVLASLNALAAAGDLTLIVIAHRQSTIAACDFAVRLENGRLA